jgi:hypothetical protein
MPLPNFFIPGAGRRGTTSLAGLLRLHPDVFIPEMMPLEYRRVPATSHLREVKVTWNRAPRPALLPATRASLMERFESDLVQLRELVGVDLLE